MTNLSLAGVFAAVTLAAGCSRPAKSAADTSAASSTAAQAAAPRVDTVSTTTEVATSSSTVTRKSSGKKLPVSPTRKADSNKARATDSLAKDPNILGRDSVIRFPIRRLPTASSTPAKR